MLVSAEIRYGIRCSTIEPNLKSVTKWASMPVIGTVGVELRAEEIDRRMDQAEQDAAVKPRSILTEGAVQFSLQNDPKEELLNEGRLIAGKRPASAIGWADAIRARLRPDKPAMTASVALRFIYPTSPRRS